MKYLTSLTVLKKQKWQEILDKLAAQEKEIVSATGFIKEIEKGNLDETETENVDPNSLTGSLIKMRNRMKVIAQEERERNWVTEGLAKFSEILRSNNKDLAKLSNDIIC